MTHDEAVEIAVGAIVAGSSGRITESVARQRGTTAYAACNIAAALAVEIAWQDIERHAAQFLDTAVGDDLSQWGSDRYKQPRHDATASIVDVTLERTSTVAAVIATVGSMIATPEGVRFELDEDVEFLIGDAGPYTVGATAIQLGPSSNVDAAKIDRFVGAAPQSDMTVTNAEEASGGNVTESDEQYRARLREFFLASQRGTLQAIRQGALNVEAVREAAAYEPVDLQGHPGGDVIAVIADENGGSNAALEALVEAELENWRAAGVFAEALGATVVYVDVDVSITYKPGFATPAANRAVRQAIVARVNTRDPNGGPDAASAPEGSKVQPGLVFQGAMAVPGVVSVDVNQPAAPIAPDHGEILRTTLGRVTIS